MEFYHRIKVWVPGKNLFSDNKKAKRLKAEKISDDLENRF